MPLPSSQRGWQPSGKSVRWGCKAVLADLRVHGGLTRRCTCAPGPLRYIASRTGRCPAAARRKPGPAKPGGDGAGRSGRLHWRLLARRQRAVLEVTQGRQPCWKLQPFGVPNCRPACKTRCVQAGIAARYNSAGAGGDALELQGGPQLALQVAPAGFDRP